ncbi:unnamed protein product, partial [Rotaria sp. Silwood1]
MLMFLVAGYETTSTALAWFVHLISKNPRVQVQIKAELGDNKSQRLSIEQLDSLEYLNCVIDESLRFAPPGSYTVCNVTIDDRLPGSGTQLYKGDEVMINIYNLTRDKRYWKIDPDLFYPERFQGVGKDHHLYALIPFGGGYRQCVGQDLARLELKAITTRLIQHVMFGDGGQEVNAGDVRAQVEALIVLGALPNDFYILLPSYSHNKQFELFLLKTFQIPKENFFEKSPYHLRYTYDKYRLLNVIFHLNQMIKIELSKKRTKHNNLLVLDDGDCFSEALATLFDIDQDILNPNELIENLG